MWRNISSNRKTISEVCYCQVLWKILTPDLESARNCIKFCVKESVSHSFAEVRFGERPGEFWFFFVISVTEKASCLMFLGCLFNSFRASGWLDRETEGPLPNWRVLGSYDMPTLRTVVMVPTVGDMVIFLGSCPELCRKEKNIDDVFDWVVYALVNSLQF